MPSGDGLIVRVRPHMSRLSLLQLETLAGAARRFGDRNLYLSNRANVQIRGVTVANHPALLDVLASVSLLDADPRVEAVRNIMVSPQTGLSGHEELAAGLAAKLEDVLTRNEELKKLPGKFGIAIQAADEADLTAVSDVTFLADGDGIAMLLEGEPGRAFSFGSTRAAADGFAGVASAFVRLRRANPAIRRMRDAVSQLGIEAVAKEAGLPHPQDGVRLTEGLPRVGDWNGAFGIGFAFGEITQSALHEITGVMRREGIAETAISPHRALVFAAAEKEKTALQELAGRIGAITSADDIRLRIHACPGAPACSRSTVAARADAEAVLRALGSASLPRMAIHVSGCEKRCAYPHDAHIAAIGGDGSYTVTGPGPRTACGVSSADLPATIAEFARIA
jgi:precorrin-3B synthase